MLWGRTVIDDPRLRPFMRAKIRVDDAGCWLWQGNKSPAGYGQVWIDDERYQAHRVTYEDLVGPIGEGLVCDHLCRVRHCVNPFHLEPVTHAENLRRGVGGRKARERAEAVTHCPKGHEYTSKNTYLAKRSDGRPYRSRQCKACTNVRRARAHARARAQSSRPSQDNSNA